MTQRRSGPSLLLLMLRGVRMAALAGGGETFNICSGFEHDCSGREPTFFALTPQTRRRADFHHATLADPARAFPEC